MEFSRKRPRSDDHDAGESLPSASRARLHDQQSDAPQSGDGEEKSLPLPPARAGSKLVASGNLKSDSKLSRFVYQYFAPNEYEHEKLNPAEDQIRLLNLHPGSEGDAIECFFEVVSLKQTSNYEALSYYWGIEPADRPIFVKNLMIKKKKQQSGKSSRDWRALARHVRPKKFYIRPNLHAALCQFRDKERHIFLWVDALCINQEDEKEKTQQVQKMARIYSKAFRVLIWLGAGKKKCEEALDFIDEVLNLESFDTIVKDEKSPPKWAALVELMRCDWFSRRWVVQELALADDATLHYGDKHINWKRFADAVAIFSTRFDAIKQLFLPSREFNHNVEHLGDVEALGANILVDVTANHFRRSSGAPDNLERLSSLEALVSRLLKFEASDPRDTVYALLSICNGQTGLAGQHPRRSSTLHPTPGFPNSGTELVPDYTKTMIEVYRDFTRYCVNTSRSVDIICRHWAPSGSSKSATLDVRMPRTRKKEKQKLNAKMPSWIPQLSDSPFGGPGSPPGRVNGDSLVGHPDHRSYNACGGKWEEVRFENIALDKGRTASNPGSWYRPSTGLARSPEQLQSPEGELIAHADPTASSKSTSSESSSSSSSSAKSEPLIAQEGEKPEVNAFFMFVTGIQVDTVTEVTSRIPGGILTKESLKMGGWDGLADPEQDEIPDELWRTLVADRGPSGGNPPGWYHRACWDCFHRGDPSGDVNMSSLITNPKTPSLMVEFLKRVQGIVWNRLFVRSQGRKLFGLGPQGTQKGDLICILYGCSVPVILRPQRDASGPDIKHYEIVGESYIYGMMNGEAISKVEAEIGAQEFKLG